MIKTDMHTHTTASVDGYSTMRGIAQAAQAAGLSTICLTEHRDHLHLEDVLPWMIDKLGFSREQALGRIVRDGDHGYIHVDYDEYLEEVQALNNEYDGTLELLFGIELGLCQNFRDELETFAASLPFDFIIGSQHTVAGRDINSSGFFDLGKKVAYTTKLEEMLSNAETFDCFDVFGHLDYVARYAPYGGDTMLSMGEFGEVIDEFLKALIRRGKGIEINTSGMRYGLGYVHPQPEILRRYKELGGEIITVGSDAHHFSDVGANLKEAQEALWAAGFTAYTTFKKRKPIFIDL